MSLKIIKHLKQLKIIWYELVEVIEGYRKKSNKIQLKLKL